MSGGPPDVLPSRIGAADVDDTGKAPTERSSKKTEPTGAQTFLKSCFSEEPVSLKCRLASASVITVVTIGVVAAGVYAMNDYLDQCASKLHPWKCPVHKHRQLRMDMVFVAAVLTSLAALLMVLTNHPPSSHFRASVFCVVMLWIGTCITVFAIDRQIEWWFKIMAVGQCFERGSCIFAVMLIFRRLQRHASTSGQDVGMQRFIMLFLGAITVPMGITIVMAMPTPKNSWPRINDRPLGAFSNWFAILIVVASGSKMHTTLRGFRSQLSENNLNCTTAATTWARRQLLCEMLAAGLIVVAFSLAVLMNALYYSLTCEFLRHEIDHLLRAHGQDPVDEFHSFVETLGYFRFATLSCQTIITAMALVFLSGASAWSSQSSMTGDEACAQLLDEELRLREVGEIIKTSLAAQNI